MRLIQPIRAVVFPVVVVLAVCSGCGGSGDAKPAATPAELTLRQGDQFSAVPAPSWDFGGDCVNGVQTVVLLPEKGQTTDKVVFTINRDRKVTDDEAPLTSPSSDKASG